MNKCHYLDQSFKGDFLNKTVLWSLLWTYCQAQVLLLSVLFNSWTNDLNITLNNYQSWLWNPTNIHHHLSKLPIKLDTLDPQSSNLSKNVLILLSSKQWEAVRIHWDCIRVPPQPCFPSYLKLACHGMDPGITSLPPTILQKLKVKMLPWPTNVK